MEDLDKRFAARACLVLFLYVCISTLKCFSEPKLETQSLNNNHRVVFGDITIEPHVIQQRNGFIFKGFQKVDWSFTTVA